MGKLRNYFLNHYPRTDFHELNQDWMISMLFDMINQVENFVEMNSVKYADPIQWDITRQYEKNTIVMDPITGTAYLSNKPVPIGVALSRTEYWSVVFDLGRFITLASQNFANSYEAVLTTTATMPTDKDKWVVWNSILYRAKNDIHVGDRYVIDGNIEKYTVEMFFDELAHLIAEETEARIEADTTLHGEIVDESVARENADTTLQDNIDAEATARENADTTLQDNIDTEVGAINTTIGSLSNLITSDKSSIVNAINEVKADIENIKSTLMYFNVKEYGAYGDGIHNDTNAFKAAIADAKNNGGGIVFVPKTNARYIITDKLTLDGKIYIEGEGRSTIAFSSTILFDFSHRYGGLKDLEIISINGVGTGVHYDISNSVCYECRYENLVFDNCQHAFDDTGIGDTTYIVDMIYDDILMVRGNGDQFVSRRSRGFMTLHNFKVDWTYNTSLCPYVGAKFLDVLGLELEKFDVLGPVSRNVPAQYTPAQIGLYILGSGEGTASIWLTRINIDTTYGNGIVISNIRYAQGDLIECFGVWGFGLLMEDCMWFNFTNVYLVCFNGTTDTPNGLSMTRCFDGMIANLMILDWKDHALVLNNSNRIMITNVVCNANNVGVLEVDEANSNIISNITFLNNTNDYSLAGAQSRIINAMVDGVFTPLIPT